MLAAKLPLLRNFKRICFPLCRLTFIFAAVAEFVVVSRRVPDDLEKGDAEDKIDITARVVYPATYAAFVLIYSLSALLR